MALPPVVQQMEQGPDRSPAASPWGQPGRDMLGRNTRMLLRDDAAAVPACKVAKCHTSPCPASHCAITVHLVPSPPSPACNRTCGQRCHRVFPCLQWLRPDLLGWGWFTASFPLIKLNHSPSPQSELRGWGQLCSHPNQQAFAAHGAFLHPSPLTPLSGAAHPQPHTTGTEDPTYWSALGSFPPTAASVCPSCGMGSFIS